MRLSGLLRAVMGAAARRPLLVGLAVGLLALAGGILALRLQPTAATDTLVGRGSPSFAATERLHQRFGDEAVYVLVREPVTQVTLTSDILRVQGLEGCISGNVPKGQVPPGGKDGPCAQLAAMKPAKVVFGPGTFLNEAIGQIQDQFNAESTARAAQAKRAAVAARALARAQHKTPAQVRKYGEQAKQLVEAEFAKTVIALALKYGIRSAPQLNDPQFVSQIVFDDTKGPGVPKGRFAYIFPNKNSALIQVRFRSNLSESERDRAIGLVRQAVAMPEWKLPNGKGTYVVTGAPVVVSDLTTLDQPLAHRAARGRARRDGPHADPGLPGAAAAAAARRRPGRRRTDLRRALARRGVADHGLDRGAPGAHRVVGRLRDPAAGAGAGGPGRRGRDRGGGAAHRRARRPDGGDGRRGHGGRLPRPRALARAHGARLRAAAGGGHRPRPRLCADAGRGRPRRLGAAWSGGRRRSRRSRPHGAAPAS